MARGVRPESPVELLRRVVREERGVATLPYVILSLFCTTAVFRPDLIAAAAYRLADLFSLFQSQVEFLFSSAACLPILDPRASGSIARHGRNTG